MKSKILTWYTIFSLVAALITSPLDASLFITGNGTFPLTFIVPVTAETFDRTTGTLYVGLAAGGATYAISKASRCFLGLNPKFTDIAPTTSTITTNQAIQQLALVQTTGTPATALAGFTASAPKQVFVTSTTTTTAADGTVSIVAKQSPVLVDANGNATSGIAATGTPIASIAANEDFIFAAVGPSGGAYTFFGGVGSGIAVVRINRNDLLCADPLSSLIQTEAVAGTNITTAMRFDPITPELFINNTLTAIDSSPVLFWDDQLQRLYIGDTAFTNAAANSGGRSVVVARINDMGVMTYSDIAPDAAVTSMPALTQQQIVAGLHSDAVETTLSVNALRVMHASTGPSYLIVNGGNGDLSEKGSYIFALPLVDLREEDGDVDTADDADHGTLADKNSALVDGKFVVPASAAGELVNDPTVTNGADSFALVGGSALPLNDGSDNQLTPSDIVVVGDTVYASSSFTQSSTTEEGILYSQAKFDDTGKIVGWTPWSKRAFPLDGLPNEDSSGIVEFFEVDAVTGKVWAIGGDTFQTVARSQWDINHGPDSLVTMLNTKLHKGCYSVLDLDAFTRGFDGATASRYALFGGTGTVIFTQVSQSLKDTASNAPQMVITDFTEPENFMPTTLGQKAGCATVLEYSRRDGDNLNYFFAGTGTGLFVYANASSGAGFLASDLGDFDSSTAFTTGGWRKAPNIPGAVIDVKTLGNALYVLTYNTTRENPMQNTLYRVAYSTTVNLTFANPVIIAQTNVDEFEDISSFTSIQLISTADDSSTEQLVLGTNEGVWRTAKVGGVQTATSQADAAWEIVPEGDEVLYNSIAGMDPSVLVSTFFTTGGPSTVWPVSVEDQNRKKTFDRSSVQQLNGTTDTDDYTFVPEDFNANSADPAFNTLLPTTRFWSDGARRFFIVKQAQGSLYVNKLMVLPFEVDEWGISNPDQNILSDSVLTTIKSFNWVRQIGITGILMAGTSSGVVALE